MLLTGHTASRKPCSTTRTTNATSSVLRSCIRATSDRWECEANYAVFRTKLSDTTTVFNVGRSFDTIVRADDGLRFSRRECIYDSEMIPNALFYPV